MTNIVFHYNFDHWETDNGKFIILKDDSHKTNPWQIMVAYIDKIFHTHGYQAIKNVPYFKTVNDAKNWFKKNYNMIWEIPEVLVAWNNLHYYYAG